MRLRNRICYGRNSVRGGFVKSGVQLYIKGASDLTVLGIPGLFSFWQQPWTHGCDTIVDFIERCMMHSRDGSFMYFLRPAGMANMAPMPLLLLHPVSRLFKVKIERI